MEPNRSRLEARQGSAVLHEIQRQWPAHVAGVWEDLVRASIPRTGYFNRSWGVARARWGPRTDRAPLEVDIVAESTDGTALLLGEVEWSSRADPQHLRAELHRNVTRLPFARGREVLAGIWTPVGAGRGGHFGPRDILRALR